MTRKENIALLTHFRRGLVSASLLFFLTSGVCALEAEGGVKKVESGIEARCLRAQTISPTVRSTP